MSLHAEETRATRAPTGLSSREIIRIVKRYIGVEGGYLGDFSYGSHSDFYPEYCDLDINPFDYLETGTTRERFIRVLQENPPHVQAKIIRGVIEKYPVGSSELRTPRLQGGRPVNHLHAHDRLG